MQNKIQKENSFLTFLLKKAQKIFTKGATLNFCEVKFFMKKKTIQLPKEGIPYDEILNEMKEIQKEDIDWHHGKAFGYVYHWTDEHTAFLKEAHNLFFSTNALSPLAFPSLKKFEKEVISMAGDLFHGDYKVVGNITSGGTESILMAVKTYRDWARKMHPEIKQPEIVLPISAHPAFNKAGHYFDVSMVYIPLDQEDHADLNALKAAINPNTILVVGSACDYPRGGMDPIEEMSKIALENEIPFHTDSCLGGYMLPFLKKLGYPIPKFDFEIPGVTSISADLHKYGHTAKGASTLIFRNGPDAIMAGPEGISRTSSRITLIFGCEEILSVTI